MVNFILVIFILVICCHYSQSVVSECHCVEKNSINSPCVQKCIDNITDYSCNRNRCFKDLQAWFDRQSQQTQEHLPWVSVKLTSEQNEYSVSLKNYAAHQLNLGLNASFDCKLTPLVLVENDYTRSKCFADTDKSKLLYTSVPFRHIGRFNNSITNLVLTINRKNYQYTTINVRCEIEFDINDEDNGVLIWKKHASCAALNSDILSKPTVPRNVDLEAYFYSEQVATVIVHWSCPEKWHAPPFNYEVLCTKVSVAVMKEDLTCAECNKDHKKTLECTKCWENTLQSSDFSSSMHATADYHHYKHAFTVSHNKKHVDGDASDITSASQARKRPSDHFLELDPRATDFGQTLIICRVRAMTSIMEGDWSTPVATTLASQRYLSLLAVEQYFPKLDLAKQKELLDQAYYSMVYKHISNIGIAVEGRVPTRKSVRLLVQNETLPARVLKRKKGQGVDTWTVSRYHVSNGQLGALAVMESKPLVDGSDIKGRFESADEPEGNLRQDCYDYISTKYYFLVKKKGDQNRTWIVSTIQFAQSYSSGARVITERTGKYITYLAGRENIPEDLRCLPTMSSLLWTERPNGNLHYDVYLGRLQRHEYEKEIRVTLLHTLFRDKICKNALLHVISPAVAVHRNRHPWQLAEDVVVVTLNGIWSISVHKKSCQELIPQSDLEKYSLFDVISTAIDHSTFYFVTTTFKGVIFKYSFITNKTYSVNSAVKLRSEVPRELMNQYPNFPSHTAETVPFKHIVKIANAIELPGTSMRPPVRCVFPSIQNIDAEMVTDTDARFHIQVHWSEDPPCNHISKPFVLYELKYIALRKQFEHSNFYCVNSGCPCQLGLSPCQQTMGQITRNKTGYAAIGGLITGRVYHLEVSALPLMNKSLMSTWYGGVWPDTYVTKFNSTYVAPIQKKIWPILVGSLLPLFLLLTGLIGSIWWAYKKRWYIHRKLARITAKQLRQIEKMGEGYFGEVWKSELLKNKKKNRAGGRIVAVKFLKPTATDRDRRKFLEEALTMSQLDHKHIVKVLGICLDTKPVLLALEYYNGGSLKSLLVASYQKGDPKVSAHDMAMCCLQLVNACCYLEEKFYVHRDISAKNCLVKINKHSNSICQVALADFGLAKDVNSMDYNRYTSNEAEFPLLYTAPEGFTGQFSSKSDVWSFGVLIWEIFTWSSTPFGTCSMQHSCPNRVLTGKQVEFAVCVEKKSLFDFPQPCNAQLCPSILNILSICFSHDPAYRPTFKHLEEYLKMCFKTSLPSTPASYSVLTLNEISFLPRDRCVTEAADDVESTTYRKIDPNCMVSDTEADDSGMGSDSYYPVSENGAWSPPAAYPPAAAITYV